jgi:subtilase family serine protease
MKNLRTLPLLVLVSALLFSSALTAQRFAPTLRIVDRIDERSLVTLKGNVHPFANAKYDRGLVSPDLPMTDLIMVLSRDPAQQATFEKFVASQYDSNSPNFHQWLTPDQVGTNFGPSQTDIATVTDWLTGHGFTVNDITKDRMSIRFSGTAAQVQSTFHTEIHNLVVKGEAHIGNMSDPQIPSALSPVIIGVKSLHNFFPHPLHHIGSLVTKDTKTGQWARIPGTQGSLTSLSAVAVASAAGAASPRTLLGKTPANSAPNIGALASKAAPQFGITVGGASPFLVEDIGPYDFATIYNILPLWKAGIDGSGQTIAIAGTSSIVLNDVATFRNFFLPSYTSTPAPILISGNSSPLTVCTSTTGTTPFPTAPCTLNDLLENTLDVEWSGAIAPKAQIVLVSSYPNSASDDNLYDSESYIVNHLTARIMNVSYGECELGLGTAGNVQYYNLWQTAASEGISVFVATGDSGAPSCDAGGDNANGPPAPAEYGLSVSGLASTPYNTAVGGTDFNWCSLTATQCTAAPFWSTTNTGNANAPESSALGYVPEVPWNDTCTSPVALAWMKNYWSGINYTNANGGSVSVTDAETACNAFVYYSQQLSSGGNGTLLYLVDTVGGSGGASGCIVGDGANVSSCSTSTTTTGASNGSIPLTKDGWQKPSWQTGVTGIPSDGVRDIPDVSFFAADGFLSSSAYLICVSNATVDSQCAYSSSHEPTAQEVGGTSVATPAMAGVMALINQKTGAAQGNPNAELYKLASQQTYSACSAENVTAGSTSCYFNDIDTGTIAMPCDYSAFTNTPSPNCTLAHSNDSVGILTGYSAGVGYDQATGLGSMNVYNVVHAWISTLGAAAATVTVTPAVTTLNSSNSLSVTVSAASAASGGTIPSGSITLTASSPSTYTVTQPLSNAGSTTFTLPPSSLGAGKETLTGIYGGDNLYASAQATAQVTVTNLVLPTPTITVIPASTTLNSNATLGVTGTVAGSGVTPTGTVTLTTGSYTSAALTLATGAYSFTGANAIPANTLASGSNTIKVSYSGDTNYAAGSNTATVTVTASTFTLNQPAVSVSPTSISPGGTASATVTVAAVSGYTGTVTLSCAQTSTTASGGDGATCSGGGTLSPVTLSSTTTSGTVKFTIGTSVKIGALAYPKVHNNDKGWLSGGAVLAFMVFLGIPARRRAWRQMLGMLVLIAALAGLSSCGGGTVNSGGGGNSDPGTTAGTYTFTVQATGSPTVTPAVTSTFTVTVN